MTIIDVYICVCIYIYIYIHTYIYIHILDTYSSWSAGRAGPADAMVEAVRPIHEVRIRRMEIGGSNRADSYAWGVKFPRTKEIPRISRPWDSHYHTFLLRESGVVRWERRGAANRVDTGAGFLSWLDDNSDNSNDSGNSNNGNDSDNSNNSNHNSNHNSTNSDDNNN